MTKKFMILLLLIGLISSSAYFIFPHMSTLTQLSSFTDKTALAVSFAIFMSQAVAAWYFLTSLGAFKKTLKIAYIFVALGIFIFAINQLQLPAGTFIALDPVVAGWYITLSLSLGSLCMYLGAWKFGRLLQVRGFWSSLLGVSAIAVVLAIATTFVSHAPEGAGISERVYDGVFATYMLGAGFCIGAAALTLRLKKKLGASYKQAMGWLAAGFAVAAFAIIHETTIRLLPLESMPSAFSAFFDFYFSYGVNLLPQLAVAILFLGAGLRFKATSVELGKLPENATYLDIINYTAQIASNPADLDVTLDKVREITATQQPGKEMSAADKNKLLGVYLQIEDYLTTKEALRKLTKEDLRSRLPDTFQQALASKG